MWATARSDGSRRDMMKAFRLISDCMCVRHIGIRRISASGLRSGFSSKWGEPVH